MAWLGGLPVAFGAVFPHGAGAVSNVERMLDFKATGAGGEKLQVVEPGLVDVVRPVPAALRWWAAGSPADEAAVELLLGCLPAWWSAPARSWVRRCPRAGWWWLDGDRLALAAAPVDPADARLLGLVVALLTGDTPPAVRPAPALLVACR